jgi:hypothetical protein
MLAWLCAATSDLDAVMGLLAMRQHGRVEFIEQQFLAILDHPVESSGELRYDAPDHLEKHTLLPKSERLVLAGGVLTVERGGRRHVLDMHRYPGGRSKRPGAGVSHRIHRQRGTLEPCSSPLGTTFEANRRPSSDRRVAGPATED